MKIIVRYLGGALDGAVSITFPASAEDDDIAEDGREQLPEADQPQANEDNADVSIHDPAERADAQITRHEIKKMSDSDLLDMADELLLKDGLHELLADSSKNPADHANCFTAFEAGLFKGVGAIFHPMPRDHDGAGFVLADSSYRITKFELIPRFLGGLVLIECVAVPSGASR